MPSNLSFREAERLAHQGVYIRFPEWSDQWFVVWRFGWYRVKATGAELVQHPWYDETYANRNDWTTEPFLLDDGGVPISGVPPGSSPPPLTRPIPTARPPWPNPNPGASSGPGGGVPGSSDGTGNPGASAGTGGSSGGGVPGSGSGGSGGGTGGTVPSCEPGFRLENGVCVPIGGGGGGVACSFGTLTLNLIESCPGAVHVELIGTGLSPAPQSFSLLFTCRGQTFSGGVVFGPNFTKIMTLTESPAFASGITGGLRVNAQLTGFSGSPSSNYPCAGQVQTTFATLPYYCVCHPQRPELPNPPYLTPLPSAVQFTFDGDIKTVGLSDSTGSYGALEELADPDGDPQEGDHRYEVAAIYIPCANWSLSVSAYIWEERDTYTPGTPTWGWYPEDEQAVAVGAYAYEGFVGATASRVDNIELLAPA